jgi:putative aldouronate transport system permease protein
VSAGVVRAAGRRGNRIRQNGRVSDALIHFVFFVTCVAMLYPFWHTVVGSFLKYEEYFDKTVYLWSSDPTLEAYRVVLRNGLIRAPMYNTILITVVGTVYSLSVTAFVAYGLSKRFPGRTVIMSLIVFTMFFKGGLIPDYVLYKQLGLLNNRLVFLLPATINTFNLIVLKTSFAAFPVEMEEAARMDGSNEFGVFFRMVLPLSIPMLVTIGLFFAVHYWNTFFPSLFFVTKPHLRTLQDYLYRIIKTQDAEDLGMYISRTVSMESVRMANIVLVIAPIVLVYPVLQRYFVKGAMIGAIKG